VSKDNRKDMAPAGPQKWVPTEWFTGICGTHNGKPVYYKDTPGETLFGIEGMGTFQLRGQYWDDIKKKLVLVGR